MPFYEKDLGEGLTLRSVRDEADVARYIALNAAVTDEGMIAERLLHHHPETTYEDYLLVVDEQTGEAVSTTCLFPWRCAYEEVTLKVAMLEMVVTHAAYRRRGLVRLQIERFHEMVLERGFDLSIIQGIFYYYRQFGYTYALDHTPLISLPAWRIPEGTAESPYRFRPATPADTDDLTRFYETAMAKNSLYVQRTPAYWRYLLQHMGYPVRLVEDSHTGQSVGYICILPQGQHLRVQENSLPNYEAGRAVLRQLKTETTGEIEILGSPNNLLVQLAGSLAGQRWPPYQWLWRIPDVTRYLDKLKPVLERRLANSACAGLTAKVSLNLYRQACLLNFEAGKLTVEPLGFVDASLGTEMGDWSLPPEAFIRLSLGYRSLDQLQDAWPDMLIRRESRYLLEVLFPPMEAEILMPY